MQYWYDLDAGHVTSVWRRMASSQRSRWYAHNGYAQMAEDTLAAVDESSQRPSAIVVLTEWIAFMVTEDARYHAKR